jgi:SM-20-related protein
MLALVDAMGQFGWATVAGAFGNADAFRLREECESACQRGEFNRARVGRGANMEVRDEVRRDQVLWIEPGEGSAEQQHYLDKVETLRLLLNQRFLLGLFDFESHFAIYPPGAGYQKHLDQFIGKEERKVSCILYLNENWHSEYGGQLRMYLDKKDENRFIDISPQAGTLVVFLSSDFLHEVLPAKRERISVTGWFRTRSLS